MVKFDTLAPIEKEYAYVGAKAAADYINGAFGSVVSGTFTIGATGFYAIMEMEKGDDAYTTDFRIKKDANCRVVDFSRVAGYVIKITSEHLPVSIAVGNKMISKTDGTLNVPTTPPTTEYFEVTEVTAYGCKAKIVA